MFINLYPGGERGGEKRNRTEPICWEDSWRGESFHESGAGELLN